MPSVSLIENLKLQLVRAAKIREGAERTVSLAGGLAQALRTIGQDPVLVGGAAVEFYTQGGYSTSDIDMIAEGGRELARVMEELGFEKIGKDYLHRKLKIYVEFPGRYLKESEKSLKVKIRGNELSIISIEDLIVDRLNAFKFWQSAIDGINAMLLLEMGDLDIDHLHSRADQDDVRDALEAVRQIREEVIRKKFTKEQGNQLLIKKMKALKGLAKK